MTRPWPAPPSFGRHSKSEAGRNGPIDVAKRATDTCHGEGLAAQEAVRTAAIRLRGRIRMAPPDVRSNGRGPWGSCFQCVLTTPSSSAVALTGRSRSLTVPVTSTLSMPEAARSKWVDATPLTKTRVAAHG